jgi:hypothetical protein
MVFNTIFSNISAISWRPVLVVEEAGIPGENHHHGQVTGKLFQLQLRVECTLCCNLQIDKMFSFFYNYSFIPV